MKKRYSEQQIVKILQEGSTCESIAQLCRKYGISNATYHNWKKKYSGMKTSDLARLKNVEEENRKLKRLLADSMLDNDALKALLQKYQ